MNYSIRWTQPYTMFPVMDPVELQLKAMEELGRFPDAESVIAKIKEISG